MDLRKIYEDTFNLKPLYSDIVKNNMPFIQIRVQRSSDKKAYIFGWVADISWKANKETHQVILKVSKKEVKKIGRMYIDAEITKATSSNSSCISYMWHQPGYLVLFLDMAWQTCPSIDPVHPPFCINRIWAGVTCTDLS